MRIPKLILCEFKRLLLRGIRYFELTPTTPIQVILGTNGSGKSSVIKELSPLPAEIDNYGTNGYKEIHIEHRGDFYILKSVFSGKKGSHSFVRNGEELNKGGTITVQRDLVKAYFNYTQEIHDLLTGITRFTNMAPLKRRHWITMFSNSDYDYAIKLYNRVAERYRDVSGTLRTLKRRLVLESEKVVDIKTQEKLESEIESIHRELSKLLELRIPLDKSPEECVSEYDRIEDAILTLSDALIRNTLRIPKTSCTTIEEIDQEIAELHIQYRTAQQITESLAKEHGSVKESERILKQTNAQSQEQLSEKLKSLTEEQLKLLEHKNLFQNIHPGPAMALSALESISEALISHAQSLPINAEKYYSRETFNQNTLSLQSTEEQIAKLRDKIQSLSAEKKHQDIHRNTNETVCPKCSHQWRIGYNEATYERVCSELEVSAKILDELLQTKTKIEGVITNINDYFRTYKAITSIYDKWPILNDLWVVVADKTVILDNPGRIPNILLDYKANLTIDQQYLLLQKEIDRTKELMALASSVGNQDLDKITEKLSSLEAELQTKATIIEHCNKEIKKLRVHKNAMVEIETMQSELGKLLNSREAQHIETLEAFRRSIFNSAIKHISSTLAKKESAMVELRGQRTIISDIEAQISMLIEDEEALKLLVQELSPKEGLIAEGLLGFMKVFTSQWNRLVLDKVFSYQFEVLPCKVDDSDSVELDYRFPVKIMGNIIDDVSETSKGQMELIDLGFVVAGMKHLGLHDFPLILDEFGAHLDSQHRSNATNLVKSLIEHHQFTQLFMVNHYDSVYGAFTNAQLTVMCDGNIALPKDCVYNKHVVMKT